MATRVLMRGAAALGVLLLAVGLANGQPPAAAAFPLPLQVVGPDAQGVLRPIAGLDVFVRSAGKPLGSHRTDAAGCCRLDLLPVSVACEVYVQPTQYEPAIIEVMHDPMEATFRVVRREGGAAVTVTLGHNVRYRMDLKLRAAPPPPPPPPAAKGTLNVHVVERGAAGATPIDMAVVNVLEGAQSIAVGTTHNGGLYSKDLTVGATYTIEVTRMGYNPGRLTVTLAAGATDKTVELTRLGGPAPPPAGKGTIVVQVTEAGPAGPVPVDGANVAFRQGGRAVASGVSGHGGVYSEQLPVGQSYEIHVTKQGYTSWQALVTVAQGVTNRKAELTKLGAPPVPGLATFRVELKEPDGAGGKRPCVGALVTMKQNQNLIASGTTDAAGVVTLQVAPGKYRVDFQKAGYRSLWSDNRTLPAAGEALKLDMIPEAGAPPPPPPPPPPALPVLRLRISRLPDYAGVANAEVIVMQQGVEVKRVRSGADGMCSVPLATGTYQLVVAAAGFRTGTGAATVSPGGGSAQVTLQPN